MNTYPACYQPVADFFSTYRLPHSLKLLDKLLHFAHTGKTWPGRFPANAVCFIDSLSLLAGNACKLIKHPSLLRSVSIGRKNAGPVWQLTRSDSYCGKHPATDPWSLFPRSLSRKEFCSPGKALSRFTQVYTQEGGQQILKDILLAALSPQCLQELNDEYNPLYIRLQLHKLLEACHLIAVRIPEP